MNCANNKTNSTLTCMILLLNNSSIIEGLSDRIWLFCLYSFYTVNKNNIKNGKANYSILGTVCQYLTITGAKKNSYHTPNSTVWCSLIRLFLSSRSFQYECVCEGLWQISSSQWDSSPAAPMCSAIITEYTNPASLLRAALYVPSYTRLFSFSLHWSQACWFGSL